MAKTGTSTPAIGSSRESRIRALETGSRAVEDARIKRREHFAAREAPWRAECRSGPDTENSHFPRVRFDAVWADDFHHVVRVGQTGQREAYFEDFRGTLDELIETLRHGWLYRGEFAPSSDEHRGTECQHLPPSKFIHCISNHDQTGNRAFGERLNDSISLEAYRAVSMLLCLTPSTPMLFMGQEWAAATRFCFFTDHNDQLGPLITEGRRREFADFPEFRDGKCVEKYLRPAGKGDVSHVQAELG